MKMNLLFPASLLLMALATPFAVAQGQNIALSPSFEQGIWGWSGYPSLPIERSQEYAHSGQYSVKFPQGEPASPSWPNGKWAVSGMVSIPYKVEPGATYRCAIFARADQSVSTPATVNMADETIIYDGKKPSATGSIPPDGQWHEVSMTIPVPTDQDVLSIGVHTVGTVWVDDFSLVETSPPPVEPVSAAVSSPLYFAPGSPLSFVATIRNTQAAPKTVTVTADAWLPQGAIPSTLPAQGYTELAKHWTPVHAVVPADGSVTETFTMPSTGLSQTGVKLSVAVAGDDGSSVASADREVFICARPDWRTWFSVGAQDYQSNRFDGEWVKSLHDAGGDAVREGVPMPLSYRNAAPGQWTDYPLDDRLGYYARWGLKWLSAYHGIINNAPAWLAENPANRRTQFGGAPLQRPVINYFAPEARAALLADARAGGREISKCPVVFGVQTDNEIVAIDSYDPAAEQSFRSYVQREYGTIGAVNSAWGTNYVDFTQVNIPAPLYTSYLDDPSGLLDLPQPEKRIPARDFDWLNWREASFIDYYRDWSAAFKSTCPDVPVMTNFSLYVSALPRFFYEAPVDLFQFSKFFDVGGVDSGPSFDMDHQYTAYQFDWVNSAWGDRPVWVPEIYYDWSTANPKNVGFDLFYGMGRKVQHFSLFTWPMLSDKFAGPYTDDVRPDRAYLLTDVKDEIAQAKRFNAEVPVSSLHYVTPPVGIYWSSDVHNFQLAMGQPAWLPGTDPLYDFDKIFTDLDYPVQFVDDNRWLSGEDPHVKALFVTGAETLRPAALSKMLDYAKQGGTLFLNGNIGSYDEHLAPYSSSPCAMGASIGVTFNGWQPSPTELISAGESPLVKLGKNRKVRGFGGYAQAQLSSDWHVLLKTADGKPGLIERAYGQGHIYWSLTDIGNPYSTYQTSNTLSLVEGLLEVAGIGRFARVTDATGTSGAPEVAISVKRRTPTETYLFVNNFGDPGTYNIYLNAPLQNLTVHEMISGQSVPWSPQKQCAVISVDLPKCGYAVYRVRSAALDIGDLPVRRVLPAPSALADTASAASVPIPTDCSVTSAKGADGSPLYWLESPFVRAGVSPVRGGRLSFLSAAGTTENEVTPLKGLAASDGVIQADSGGIKAVLDPAGKGYPGLTMTRDFTVTQTSSTPDAASVSMQAKLPDAHATLDETFSTSKSDPGVTWQVRQAVDGPAQTLRLNLHGEFLLGGEVRRGIVFAAGNGTDSYEYPYELGALKADVVPGTATWGALADPTEGDCVLCVLRSGFTHVRFWNATQDYNLEAASDPATVTSATPEEGSASFYVCPGLGVPNFATDRYAGRFTTWAEAGGQSIALRLCGLTNAPQKLTFTVTGVKAATHEERVLGRIDATAQPVRGTQQTLSLGGVGSGFDTYRLYEQDGAQRQLVKEVAPSSQENAPLTNPTASSANEAASSPAGVLSWTGTGATSVTRVTSAAGWSMDQGTVKVRFQTTANGDIVHKGVRLLNGYAAAPDFNQNRASRLWFNVHGLAVWSPTAPMIFLMIYDRNGHSLKVTANATLRDNASYELAATWDMASKTAALYLDGLPLKLGESTFPAQWDGADPITTFDIGDDQCQVFSASVLPKAVVPDSQE